LDESMLSAKNKRLNSSIIIWKNKKKKKTESLIPLSTW
jgi:hypothetical protein